MRSSKPLEGWAARRTGPVAGALPSSCVGRPHAARGNTVGATVVDGRRRLDEYQRGAVSTYGLDLTVVVPRP